MRAPPAFIVAVLLAVVFSGCASTPAPGPTTSPPVTSQVPDDLATGRLVIHLADGKLAAVEAFHGALPRFEQRYVANRSAGEPTIAINEKGTILFPSIAFDTPEKGTGRTFLYLSKDEGKTWKDVTQLVGDQTSPVRSLDPYVYADPRTGRLISMDLYAACAYFLYTDDDGDSWKSTQLACGIPVDDHQSLFSAPASGPLASYPSIYYYCVNQVGGSTCSKSLDGGATWVAAGAAYPGADAGNAGLPNEQDPTAPANAFCGGLSGHGIADDRDGTLYLPKNHCGRSAVSVSHDQGATWTISFVDPKHGVTDDQGDDPNIAIDAKGNVYDAFIDENYRPRLAISKDQGKNWGPAVDVGRPGLVAAKFIAVTAGDEGRIAVYYVGSSNETAMAPDDNEGSPTKDGEDEVFGRISKARENATWDAFAAISLNALEAEPVFATAMVNAPGDPVRRGDCADRCNGMFDFLDVVAHPKTGQLYVSMVDVCTDPCAGPGPNGKGPVRGAIGVQVAGATLKA